MRITSTLLFVLLFTIALPAAAHAAFPYLQWADIYGDSGWYHEGVDVASNSTGDMAAVGMFRGSGDFGGIPLTSNGLDDVYLMKFTQAVVPAWAKGFGGAGTDYAYGVAVDDNNNVYVAGSCTVGTDFGAGAETGAGGFLVKFDSTGAFQWRLLEASAVFASVAVDQAGTVFVTGWFSGALDLGGGPLSNAGSFDMFLASFSDTGVHQWSISGGGTGSEQGQSVAIDPSGNIAVAGSTNDDASFGGPVLPSLGTQDAFIAHYGPGGVHQWSKMLAAANQRATTPEVAFDHVGNLFLALSFLGSIDLGNGPHTGQGSWDIALAKYDPAGVSQWSKAFGGSTFDQNPHVTITSTNTPILAASFQGQANFGGPSPLTSVGGTDIFLGGFDADGNYQWAVQGSGSNSSAFANTRGLAMSNQSAFLTGSFKGTLSVPGGYLNPAPCNCINSYVASWFADSGITPAGSQVPVSPVDPATGTSPITMTFDSVDAAGGTSMSIETTGPALPGSFALIGSPRYFEISTSASYTGSIELCFDYSPGDVSGSHADLQLLHYDGNSWEDITTSVDSVQNILCGVTTSLSPFVIGTEASATSAGEGPLARGPLRAYVISPNPFNPATLIRFELAHAGRVTLDVYDARGTRITTLLSDAMPSGVHVVRWDGTDADGHHVASGIYFSRLRFDELVETRRMVLVK